MPRQVIIPGPSITVPEVWRSITIPEDKEVWRPTGYISDVAPAFEPRKELSWLLFDDKLLIPNSPPYYPGLEAEQIGLNQSYSMDDMLTILGMLQKGSPLFNKTQRLVTILGEPKGKRDIHLRAKLSQAQYTVEDLEFILKALKRRSDSYRKTSSLISRIKEEEEKKRLRRMIKPGSTSTSKAYDNEEEEKKRRFKGPPPFTKPGTASTLKAPDNEEEEIGLKESGFRNSDDKKSHLQIPPGLQDYSLDELQYILRLLPEGSNLHYKTQQCILWHRREAANELKKIPAGLHHSLRLKVPKPDIPIDSRRLKVPPFTEPGTTSTLKAPAFEEEILKVQKCYFSDLTEEELMLSFGEVCKFRFVLCKVFLGYNHHDDAKARTIYRGPSNLYKYDLPKGTAHGTLVGSGHQLFGSIQAAAFSPDPASPTFNIFNRKFNDPIPVSKLGCLSPHCVSYCSIPFSTSVKIAAQLYVTTDKVVDVDTIDEYWSYFGLSPEQFNDGFEICNDSAVINFSDYLSKRPVGGSCSYTLNGRDGYLKLYYVALKYVVDAALEVVFEATSEETKVAGRIMAYYGRNFDYGCSPAEVDDYKAMLFETEQPEVKRGKINLVRSVLSVPAQFSLIIHANLTDPTSGDIVLSGVYEFFVPTDGRIRVGHIIGNDCHLKLTVDWKLPPFAEETTLDKRSCYSDLTTKQVYSPRTSVIEDEDGRWSVQKELSLKFGCLLNGSFPLDLRAPVNIFTGTEADECDYICTSVLNIWPEIRSLPYHHGPKFAALMLKGRALLPPMVESCVVGGPGFLKFKLSRTWIAESIYKMLLGSGILGLAPKLPIETAIINILPRNITKEMHMGHLQSAIIGETLARVLEFSEVSVRRRFHYGDHLDIESKMMMTEFLIDRFPNGEVTDQAVGEFEVLYEESKKRFAEDAEFRERTQPVKDWDERHSSAWEQICKISRERYHKVYQRLDVCVKEEDKTLHDYYIRETQKLLRKEGYITKGEGDEVIVIEGRSLRLVDFAALWHSLEKGKADRIVHVTDVGQRDKIEMCIAAAESVGWTVTNDCHDPVSHVGFVQVSGFEGSCLGQLLDEAKSRCKAVLLGKGKKLEHTAEALGYGAVKYEVLKNNRLTDYTFSFDNMLRETGNTAVYLQKTYARISSSVCKSNNIMVLTKNLSTRKDCLSLKDDRERQLGLHLLRFAEVLGEVCRLLAPHILCDYLFVLCDKFNGLYADNWQVRSDEDSKILLFEATRWVISTCFDLFGITPIYNI